MIRSFVFDGRLLSLVPEAVQKNKSLNIFSADSMTLLVGPNGSGKTTALAHLASMFDVEPDSESSIGITNGIFSKETLGDVDDLDGTYAVYYTAVPFGRGDLPSNNARFTGIAPEPKHRRMPPDLGIAMPVLSHFGLNITTTLRLRRAYTQASELLLNTVGSPRSLIADEWLQPIRVQLTDLDRQEKVARLARIERGVSYLDYWNGEDAKFRRDRRDAIQKKFRKLLQDHIGEDYRLKLRALWIARNESRKTKDAYLQLLKDIGFTLHKNPSRKQPAISRVFSSVFDTLKSIAHIVKDPVLRHQEYEVDTSQWRALTEIDISRVASLSVTELSSGGEALLEQFSALKRAVDNIPQTAKKLLLLIDEGDVYLHLAWQQKYVDFLDSMIATLWRTRFNCIQVVMTTHSPMLMSDFPRDCIHRMTYRDESQPQEDKPIVSFAAPPESVIHYTGNSGTLGSFAERIIRELANDIANREAIDDYRLDMIDDKVIVRQLRRMKSDLAGQLPFREG